MTRNPADRRQRLEVIRARFRRRQQQEDEVDGTAVDRLIIERFGEPDEQAVDLLQPVDLAMRNGDALAEPGRPELLALRQAREDRRGIESEPSS